MCVLPPVCMRAPHPQPMQLGYKRLEACVYARNHASAHVLEVCLRPTERRLRRNHAGPTSCTFVRAPCALSCPALLPCPPPPPRLVVQKCGFQREGVMRASAVKDGEVLDQVWCKLHLCASPATCWALSRFPQIHVPLCVWLCVLCVWLCARAPVASDSVLPAGLGPSALTNAHVCRMQLCLQGTWVCVSLTGAGES